MSKTLVKVSDMNFYIEDKGNNEFYVTVENFSIKRFANALSKIKRFNGFGCSVLTHSYMVYTQAAMLRECNKAFLVAALLHDAHEIVTNDIPAPICAILGERLEKLKLAVDGAILRALNYEYRTPVRLDLLHHIDKAVCQLEMYYYQNTLQELNITTDVYVDMLCTLLNRNIVKPC